MTPDFERRIAVVFRSNNRLVVDACVSHKRWSQSNSDAYHAVLTDADEATIGEAILAGLEMSRYLPAEEVRAYQIAHNSGQEYKKWTDDFRATVGGVSRRKLFATMDYITVESSDGNIVIRPYRQVQLEVWSLDGVVEAAFTKLIQPVAPDVLGSAAVLDISVAELPDYIGMYFHGGNNKYGRAGWCNGYRFRRRTSRRDNRKRVSELFLNSTE